ncbi:MAG TPA: sulfatase-like hydrolase/transferase [Verrucomicrobiota bacterium]|jgi:hypothetical protein|nr:sulfatase-like hydrolase/transferase [Verrucomicrobiota bacterium]HNV00671.1 sulfatase-like hydrolase/transferase [Verrucomicrobiota bacterium]HOA62538.1 sulfatase-like hydrolase/transferase [Verrucomicrobiota bacterium]HOF48984.1 sulfatase-like hydrolase/transferase [Verrucomicrobiota bacterium]HOG88452.1 sulfatase-like hydrolase/transferase [Verrucomicrobiota bacterium]
MSGQAETSTAEAQAIRQARLTRHGGFRFDSAAWRAKVQTRTHAIQLAEYYGLITHMDEQIGRILTALEAAGHARRTLIVYAADNGLALGIVYPKIGHAQLFDLQNDPHEITNLVDHSKHSVQVARLRLLMRQWQARVGDALEIPDSHKQPDPIDLTGRPRVPDQWQPEWIVKKYFDL